MVYAPPNATIKYHTDLTNYLTTITSQSDPVIIFVDFNKPDINWFTLTGSSIASNNFCEVIFQSNLDQIVTFPTHKHGNVLDLILTDSAESIVNLIVHPLEYQCIPSDHYLISFTTCYKYTTSKPVTKEIFNYARGDFVSLNEYLLICDYSVLYNLTDVEEI